MVTWPGTMAAGTMALVKPTLGRHWRRPDVVQDEGKPTPSRVEFLQDADPRMCGKADLDVEGRIFPKVNGVRWVGFPQRISIKVV